MINRNLNGSDITFEQDGKLQFNEEAHRYSLNGVEFRSVSNVVAMFFREFDAMGISLKKCKSSEEEQLNLMYSAARLLKESMLLGFLENQSDEKKILATLDLCKLSVAIDLLNSTKLFQAARLREEWESKGAIASQAGTFVHKQIEDYLNGKQTPDLLCDVSYNGEYVKVNKTVDISREWSYFKAFERNTPFKPFRTEWRVYDADARIAGTLDFVCCCPDGTYEIYDWKRSNKIDPTERNLWANGLNGLEHLTDTSYSHYCLQQNLYRYMLQKNYGLKVSRMNLVVLHPELPTYRVVPIPPMDREISIIVDYIKITTI